MLCRRVPERSERSSSRADCEAICILSSRPEKSIDFVGAFFNEINPFRICEMHFVREILLRNVKYALRRVIKDLFHFTESDSFLFHNFDRNYFTSNEVRYFTKIKYVCIYFVLESQKYRYCFCNVCIFLERKDLNLKKA